MTSSSSGQLNEHDRPVLENGSGKSGRIFVIHGRNHRLRGGMFDFLRSIGLKPLEFAEARGCTGEPSPYIGEILDAAFQHAQAVVVLLTPDDEVRLAREFQTRADPAYEKSLTRQARPNVLFEAGMARASHPKQTILVQIGEVKPFSDIGGKHLVHMDNSPEKRQELANRLEDAGCPVNLRGLDWHKAGDFSVGKSSRLSGWIPSISLVILLLLCTVFLYRLLRPRSVQPPEQSVLSFRRSDLPWKGVMVVIPSTSSTSDYYQWMVCPIKPYHGLPFCKPQEPIDPLYNTGNILPHFEQLLTSIVHHSGGRNGEQLHLALEVSWPNKPVLSFSESSEPTKKESKNQYRKQLLDAKGYDVVLLGGPVRTGYFYEIWQHLGSIPFNFSKPVYDSVFCHEDYLDDPNNGIVVAYDDQSRQLAFEKAVELTCSERHSAPKYYYPSLRDKGSEKGVWDQFCDANKPWKPPKGTYKDEQTNIFKCAETKESKKDIPIEKSGDYTFDHSLILIGPNPFDPTRKLILIAGIHALGTEGGLQYIETLRNEEDVFSGLPLTAIQHITEGRNGPRYVTAILEVSKEQGRINVAVVRAADFLSEVTPMTASASSP